MPSKTRKMMWIILAFATITLVWGSTYAVIRVVVTSMPPYLMAGARYLLAGLVLYLVLRLRGAARPTLDQWKGPLVAGALMLGGAHGLVCWAELTLDSSLAAILMATGPMWMVLLDWLLFGGVRPGGWTGLGLVAGFLGVVLLSEPGASGPLTAIIAVAVAAPLWSLGALAMRQLTAPGQVMMSSAQAMLVGGVCLLAVGLLRGEASQLACIPHQPPAAARDSFAPSRPSPSGLLQRTASTPLSASGPRSPKLLRSHTPRDGVGEKCRLALAEVSPWSWLCFAYLVLFGSIGAYVAYGWLLRQVGAAAVSSHAFANPLVAMVLGYFWLDEGFTLRTAAGAALVVLAVAVVLRRPGRSKPPLGTETTFEHLEQTSMINNSEPAYVSRGDCR